MNISDIIKIIVNYLPVKYRLVCKKWSLLIPYNANNLSKLLNRNNTRELILNEIKDDKLYLIVSKILEDYRFDHNKCISCSNLFKIQSRIPDMCGTCSMYN